MRGCVPIVLAAGAGRRLGRNKALAELSGRTFLEWIVGSCTDPRLAEPHVVVGAEAAAVRERHSGLRVRWVSNPDWDSEEMIDSLRRALAPVGRGVAALVWPVDGPYDASRLLPGMLDVLEARPDRFAVVPEHAGAPGHPVLLSAEAVRRIATGEGPHLAAVLERFATRVERVPGGTDAVLRNVDDGAALERLERSE